MTPADSSKRNASRRRDDASRNRATAWTLSPRRAVRGRGSDAGARSWYGGVSPTDYRSRFRSSLERKEGVREEDLFGVLALTYIAAFTVTAGGQVPKPARAM